jgi:trigger factor
LEITLEKKDSTNATIKVNLTESDYQPKVVEKVKAYSKKAQLKGFRPGKVPTSLIEKMYGKSILVDEINNLLIDSLNSYIKENNLPIIGDPLPETEKESGIDWENQKNFEFNYNIGLIPEFQYDLSGVKLDEVEIGVDESIVTETLNNLRSQFGKMTTAQMVEQGDSVFGTLQFNGETKDVTIDLTKTQKGIAEKFNSKKQGDVIVFDIQNLFDDSAVLAYTLGASNEEVSKITGEVSFTIITINRPEKAELNQDFYDKIFGVGTVTTEDEFLKKLKDTVQENYTKESEFLFKRDLQTTLLDTIQIDLPNEFLKKWLLISNQGKITEEQIEKEYDFYLKELKWTLIKNRIAKDHTLKVENEEVLAKSKEMFLQQLGGMAVRPEMEETINNIANNYLKQDKGKNYIKIYEEALEQKIFSFIRDKITIHKKKISVEEFKKLI